MSLCPGIQAGEKEAMLALRKLERATFKTDHDKPGGPVIEADLGWTGASNADLVHVKELKSLIKLNLDYSEVTDAGLVELKDLRNLQFLGLAGTNISDRGVAQLKSLNQLQSLDIGGTKVSDESLIQISSLKMLRTLNLDNTKISDVGLARLTENENLQHLSLSGTKITDTGLVHIKELKNLRTLTLFRTEVSSRGLAHLSELKNLERPVLDVPEVEVGFLDERRIFAGRGQTYGRLYRGNEDEYQLLAAVRLSYAVSTLKTGEKCETFQFRRFVDPPSCRLRWRIKHGVFWVHSEAIGHRNWVERVPVTDLHLFGPEDWYGFGADGKKRKAYPVWPLDPLDKIRGDQGGDPGKIYFDFVPTAVDEGLLFVQKDNRMLIWKAKGKRAKRPVDSSTDEGEWEVTWSEMKEYEFPSMLEGPFQVFPGADRWFFLTGRGRLYESRNEKQGGPGLALVWRDEDSPVRVLIADTTSEKVYAFTVPNPGAREGRSVYFELAVPPQPKPYAVKPGDGVELKPPLNAVWKLAQVLIAQGKVKSPPAR
jgi:hypothetical protein